MCNIFVLMLIPAALFGFGWWYLRKGRRALVTPLLMGQVYALRIQNATMRVSEKIVNVPIQLNAGVTQVETTAKALRKSTVEIKTDKL